MLLLILASFAGTALLIVSTDQFVTGAGRVAAGLRVSSVLVGAVILGCGTALPELALAFQRSHGNPWEQLLGIEQGSGHTGLLLMLLLLVVIISVPLLLPAKVQRHSLLVLAAAILFAALLRGSLDRFEGISMLVGFIAGVLVIVRSDPSPEFDPFAPVIEDEYDSHGAYIEAPLMTPLQTEMTRSMIGLVGTAIGSQVLTFAVQGIVKDLGYTSELNGIIIVLLGSLLPHIVVAVQALRQHHEGLAIGNLIGSSLFHSLAIGGFVAVIRPYQFGGGFGLPSLGVMAATGVLTWLLLRTDEEEMSRPQGFGLLFAYVALVLLAVA